MVIVCLVVGQTWAVGAEPEANTPASVRQAPRVLNSRDRKISRLLPDVEFQDVAGHKHSLSKITRPNGLIVAATSTTCPLSKKYFPTLTQLARQLSAEGFGIVLVNAIATDKAVEVQEAAKAMGDTAVYVHDQQGELARALQLTSTTDVILVDPARTVLYQGAIDDQYGFGYALPEPRKRYLATALAEYRKGQSIVISATVAPGCQLDSAVAATKPATVTYHNRISRIVQSHCVGCHHEGGVGPFALDTRDDLIAHAPMITQVVQQGTMPPWFATPPREGEANPWLNNCSLSAADKDDLLTWLAADRAEGDPQDAARPSKFDQGWTIGTPDLVAKFPKPMPVQATGFMNYQHVSVELALEEDKWVERLEIRPGAPQVVHHVLVFARPPQGSPGRRPFEDGISYWGIYVPGNTKQVYPRGFARKLPKGSRLVFQMHYTPNGTATEDLTQIGFVFADREPEYEVKTATLLNTWFEIPPEADGYTDAAKVRLPADATVLGFLPHMHLRGKSC
ncbi:MAG: redoxin family protein, partial [Planctomycetes bacterium]|nr:redoxin family protein [Planctomycetota bacterium]